MATQRTLAALTIAVGLSIGGALGEVAVRRFRPQPTYSSLNESVGEEYQPGGMIPFSLRAGYRAMMPGADDPSRQVEIRTNSLGLRGPERSLAKPPNVRRVLVLGDSFTFGLYVGNEDAYPAVAERILRAQGCAVEVLNAGYADGWGPDTDYAWLVARGLAFQPDMVVYGFFGGNDFDDVDTTHWVSRDARSLPVRIADPTTYVDTSGALRSRLPYNSRTVGGEPIYRIPILRESHLAILLYHAVARRALASAERERFTGPLRWNFTARNTAEMDAKKALVVRLARGMAAVARDAGARFMVLLIPASYQVNARWLPRGVTLVRDFHPEIVRAFDSAGVASLDLLPGMQHADGAFYPPRGEIHMNENGNRFAGEALSRAVVDAGLCPTNVTIRGRRPR